MQGCHPDPRLCGANDQGCGISETLKSAGCFKVKVWADTAKFTDVIVARLRKCSDLIREGKVFIENKTKVASGVGCSERAVLYFRELLSNKKKFSFRRVESEKIGSHPRRDLL